MNEADAGAAASTSGRVPGSPASVGLQGGPDAAPRVTGQSPAASPAPVAPQGEPAPAPGVTGPSTAPGAARHARITGWGSYAPTAVLTNADLERIVETSDDWIVSRTGIRERRVAAAHETTASMAAVAGARAIAVAGLDPDEIDLILVATLTPDYWMPSTAALVKEAIGNSRAAAMDVSAACSGFVYAYATATAYVTSGMARHVLVIGAELLTRFLDYTDRSTCILFGDGAGAVVVSASEEPAVPHGIEMTTDPSGAYMIWLPAGGSKSPPSAATIGRGEHYIRMEGKETYRFATKTLASTALAAIAKAGLTPDQIDLFIPHQANIRIIEAVAKGLGLPMDEDVRQPGPLREHLRRVCPARARRGRRRRPHPAGRQRGDRGLRCRLHVRRGRLRVDRRPGRRRPRRDRPAGIDPRPASRRLGLRRPDPAPACRGPRRAGPGCRAA